MTKEYKQVVPEDFTTFSREPAAHVLIENDLIQIGGGGPGGIQYKARVLKSAGWKYGDLTSYGRNPELAAETFNHVRSVLSKTIDADEILSQAQRSEA